MPNIESAQTTIMEIRTGTSQCVKGFSIRVRKHAQFRNNSTNGFNKRNIISVVHI